MNIYNKKGIDMLRIKEKYQDKIVKKGTIEFKLTNNMSQRELKYIKLMVADEFVEEINDNIEEEKEEIVDIIQEETKKNKDVIINRKKSNE